ncbi:contractile injection system tape measure protein [Flavitalea flava]
MTHLINKLKFDLTCSAEQQAFDLRQEVSTVLLDEVRDGMDLICSKYVGEEEWIVLDHLEIDAGAFSIPSFGSSFTGVFLQEFEKALKKKLDPISRETRHRSQLSSQLELFEHLFTIGTLPWWGANLVTEPDKLVSDLLDDQPEAFVQLLLAHQADGTFWKRIGWQLSAPVRARIINLIPALTVATDFLEGWLAGWLTTLPAANEETKKTAEEKLRLWILKNAPRVFNVPVASLLKPLIQASLKELFPNAGLQTGEAAFISDLVHSGTGDADKTGQPDAYRPNQLFTLQDKKEKYFIKEAGIVLLAPYFKLFFTELGLWQNDQWTDKDASYRAVHLLKYLSTGSQNLPELSMVLEKILCSFSPDEPVPRDVLLTTKEITEAEGLLSDVIGHWKALKNTSVSGLREGFLKRDGLLTRQDRGWLLQVEKKTLDVLLEKIPWSYGLVRLPWNEYLVTVEW